MKNWQSLFLIFVFALTGCASSSVAPAPVDLSKVSVTVRGGNSASFTPKPVGRVIQDPERYDVIVIGGGLAGLSSAVYLTDAGKKILLLEKEPQVGGLAAWSETDHGLYDRGAAYWTDAYEEEMEILKHIGLGDFKSRRAIPDPIDSYYVRGRYYRDIWAKETIEKLPASFALFKFELERASNENKIPNQPFEEFTGSMDLDRANARAWIESMPAALEDFLKTKPDAEGQSVLTKFQHERSSLPGTTGMQDVVELMDLYCRSALGGTCDRISAMAFANFYISEIETRYTSPQGTGLAADLMFKTLTAREKLFKALRPAPVTRVQNTAHGVEVTYNFEGRTHRARSSYAVFAAQLKAAPALISGFAKHAAAQAKLMKDLDYSHYSVHLVQVEGQPYRASYDTWVRAADDNEDDFTDVILGQWMNPEMLGYEGYRDFKKDPPLKDGVISIYQPLSPKWLQTGYTDEEARQLALQATARFDKVFSQLPRSLWRGPLKVKSIETNRWPFSVHVPAPGHYLAKAKILRKPFGRIYFAHSNLGTPAFEEALFRGHCAADNILKKSVRKFQIESWSRCPVER